MTSLIDRESRRPAALIRARNKRHPGGRVLQTYRTCEQLDKASGGKFVTPSPRSDKRAARASRPPSARFSQSRGGSLSSLVPVCNVLGVAVVQQPWHNLSR